MNIRTNKKKRRKNNPLFYICIIMREDMIKIEKICGYEIKEQYIHLFYEKVFKDYNTYKKYCNQNNKQIIKLQKFNQVCNLIKKWRRISVDMHYKMTPDEKRKLKKILKESNKSNKRP